MTGVAIPRDQCLATYGTLAPGRANHGQLENLPGTWLTGWVFGHLQEAGWGAEMGFPGLRLDSSGDRVDLFVFVSSALPDHWQRLDAFEGAEYVRVPVQVEHADGQQNAWIYALAP